MGTQDDSSQGKKSCCITMSIASCQATERIINEEKNERSIAWGIGLRVESNITAFLMRPCMITGTPKVTQIFPMTYFT